MKLAYISECVYPFHKGGAERRIYELATRLAARGHEVHWFAMKEWTGPDDIMQDGLHVHAVCDLGELFTAGGKRTVKPVLRLAANVLRVLASGRYGRFDLVECTQFPLLHCLSAKLALGRTRFMVAWLEYWGAYWKEYLGRFGVCGQALERFVTRLPDHIVVISDLAYNGLIANGVDSSAVTKIPVGVNIDDIKRVQPSADQSDLIYFGRLKDHKNVDVLIDATRELTAGYPDLRVSIVGDGPERGRLEARARDLGVERNVRFWGRVEDVDDVMALVKSSRVFVHPSTKEGGASITSIEANACGLPVVAVRHPLGIDASLIEEGVNGAWAGELSGQAVAAKIAGLLEHPDASTADRCLAFAEQFDWSNLAARHEAIYQQLISDN